MQLQPIRQQWANFEKLMPFEKVKDKLTLPMKFLAEEITHIIPNIELAEDGPVVKSLICLTSSYVGEIRFLDSSEHFDFALKNTIVNYRIELGDHTIVKNSIAIEQAKQKETPPPEPDKVVFQKAEVTLLHQFGTSFATTLNYFGNERDSWLESILLAVPLRILTAIAK